MFNVFSGYLLVETVFANFKEEAISKVKVNPLLTFIKLVAIEAKL